MLRASFLSNMSFFPWIDSEYTIEFYFRLYFFTRFSFSSFYNRFTDFEMSARQIDFIIMGLFFFMHKKDSISIDYERADPDSEGHM